MKIILKTSTLMLVFTLLLSFITTDVYGANASSEAGTVSTKNTSLNLRKSPSLSSEVVGKVKKDSYLTLLKKEGDWWKVEYSGKKTAYAHSDYIDVVSSDVMYVNVSEGNLNVRAAARETAKIKTTLAKNTAVLVLKKQAEWSRILYNGNKTGYVKNEYLSEKKSQAKYKKITLSVPSYKQYDSRWANIRIGVQGDTIKSSGCTTTAFAMTESFHRNKTVTPADMVKELSYSSSGLLYWPDNYNTELISSQNYLQKLYSLLKDGKPVILGMKKSNGSQHWVVVTGYKKGTDSLSAENFLINDPGSEKRTLLSEFVSAYPVTYKIAYKK